ncbi:hypothetical protein C8A00DRAFT_46588 [Chaetomidium leptoderma]|uniref:Chromo domain-containing protein n=1 Tax=Chaetomidium leptoderma TaxID=669021 RepID=A0AAN6ZV20_9PEZI|nr:hypothetical protein C8A00DRAFT_46588 [Chaetomidium leptoderma]
MPQISISSHAETPGGLLSLGASRAQPPATLWIMRLRSRVVIRLSFLSRQLHDWQSYEGPVNRCLLGLMKRRGEWEAGEAGSRLLADSEVESAFLRICKYISLVPRRPSSAKMASFRGLRIREGDPSAAICGVPLHPPLPQDAHDPHRGSAGESQADAILIPSDDEFDDLDEGRSDTSFESLDGLLLDARNKVQSGRVTGTGIDAPEPSVSSMADPDNESPASPIALHTEQDRPVPASPASRRALVCAGSSCRQGDGCAKHPNLSAFYRRLRNAKSPKAKADNEGSEGDEPEPADAGLPLQPPYSQDRINFRRDVGGQCNTNLEADHRPACPPVPDDRGEQNGMCPAAPPQVTMRATTTVRWLIPSHPCSGPLARSRVNTSAPTTRRTAPKRQTPLHCTNSPPLQAQIPPPTRGPKRRQSQRSISKPQSSRGSALEEETLEAAFASFEEWPLEAVLKRVLVDGVATFQVEFTWNPCANHGRNGHTPENWRRKSPAGRTSSTGRALPLRVASTAEQVQVQVRGAKYFQVEDIQGWRQGEEGREYLVKWEGYGHKQNTWEPATHFEKCPEVLEEFHQKAGLSTAPS